MNTSLRLLSKMRLLLPVAILAVVPLRGEDINGEDHRGALKIALLRLLRCYYNFVRPYRALKFGREMRTPATQAGLTRRRLTFKRDLLIENGFSGVKECPIRALRPGRIGQLGGPGNTSGSLATFDGGSTTLQWEDRRFVRVCCARLRTRSLRQFASYSLTGSSLPASGRCRVRRAARTKGTGRPAKPRAPLLAVLEFGRLFSPYLSRSSETGWKTSHGRLAAG